MKHTNTHILTWQPMKQILNVSMNDFEYMVWIQSPMYVWNKGAWPIQSESYMRPIELVVVSASVYDVCTDTGQV